MKKIKLAYLGMPLAIIAPVATVVSCGEAKIDKSPRVSVVNSNNEFIVRINPNAFESDGKTKHGKFTDLNEFSQEVSDALNAANIDDIATKNITISASGTQFDFNSIKTITGRDITDFLDPTKLTNLLNKIYNIQTTLGNFSNLVSNQQKSTDPAEAAKDWAQKNPSGTSAEILNALGLDGKSGQNNFNLANDENGFVIKLADAIFEANLTKPSGWDNAKGDHKATVLSDTLKGITAVDESLASADAREALIANTLLGMDSLVDAIWANSVDPDSTTDPKSSYTKSTFEVRLINEFTKWKNKYTISKIDENLKAVKKVQATLDAVIDNFRFA